MKKFLFGLLGISVINTAILGVTAASTWANESKLKKGYYTMDALGCMIVRECTENVRQIKSIDNIRKEFPNSDFDIIADEFNSMLVSLDKVGVMVFLADEKYFPPGHRGVYHTVSNNFYLNDAFMHRPGVLMSVMRHEGWHAAQDCMAGSINNSIIAIIKPEEEVPDMWREMAERTYPKSAVPWEAEAGWAGRTEGMTMKALEACANGNMWEVYEPTPLTRKWLEEEGYINVQGTKPTNKVK
jgi:hypothetical protein